MPRGKKRTEIEVIQAQISEAQKRQKKSIEAATAEKRKITALEKQIEKSMAGNIAKACREKGISLEDVFTWVLAQPAGKAQPEEASPAPAAAKPGRRKAAAGRAVKKTAKPRKKAPVKRTAAKTARGKTAAPVSAAPPPESAE